MAKKQIAGDYDNMKNPYPECDKLICANVTLTVDGPTTQVNATIEPYGETPNSQQRYLLTVWNSQTKPKPATFILRAGPGQIGKKAGKKPGKK